MKNNKIKIRLKNIITLCVVTGLTVAPLFAAAIDNNNYNKEYLKMESVQEMYIAYHSRINEIFNEAIKMNLNNEGNVIVSNDDTEQNELCMESDNIATICLSIRALHEARGYKEAMLNATDTNLPFFTDDIKESSTAAYTYSEGLKFHFILEEVGGANDDGRIHIALDQTLDFYNEFMSSYEMHKSNLKLIESLEAYNKNLGKVRTQTYSLPRKFHNATAAGGGCT